MITSTTTHCLGKLPAEPRPRSLRFADYLTGAPVLPTPPHTFGHERTIGSTQWGMLGNDSVGDCVIAGTFHLIMLWNAIVGRTVNIAPAQAIATYSAITGYNPADPSTDRGTNMWAGAKYFLNHGFTDSDGTVHKPAAILEIEAGNYQEHLLACYLFGGVGLGIEFPAFADDQFSAGQAWSVQTANSHIIGGHYIPLVARRSTLEVVTWGRLQGMTEGFFKKYNDESIAYVSPEFLAQGKSPEGFNLAQLQADLAALPHE